MRTHAGKQTYPVILVMHHDEGFAEQIEIQKIAGLWNLRDVRHALPAGAKQMLRFPGEELLAGVSLRRQGDGPVQRPDGGLAYSPLDFRQRLWRLRCAQTGLPREGERLKGGFPFKGGRAHCVTGEKVVAVSKSISRRAEGFARK